MQLDPKALRSALDAYHASLPTHDYPSRWAMEEAITAYLEAAPSPSPAPGVVEAAKAVLANWDERLADGPEAYKTSADLDFSYWSPSASMVASEQMAALRAALASLSQPAKGEREGRLPTREEARQAARILLQCNGADLSKWGGDDLHDDSAQDALKELSR